MEWSTLVPVLVGGAVALGGTLLASWVAERRVVTREQRSWEREDRMRTFDDRRRAYSEFVRQMSEWQVTLNAARLGEPQLEWGWHFPLMRTWTDVDLYATDAVREAASEAFDAMFDWGNAVMTYVENGRVPIEPSPDDPDVDLRMAEAEADSRLSTMRFTDLTRRDLHITESEPLAE